MTKFKGKYRVESTRLRGWDYSSPGYYFITLMTAKRVAWFGEVDSGKMVLSPIGEIIATEWQKTAQIRLNIQLDAWVIMPDHIHGIIITTPTDDPTLTETSHQDAPNPSKNPHWKPNSPGSMVNQFKSVCTKRIRDSGYPDFAWQARYYDHIIRDETALENIRRYIVNNPIQWDLDDRRTMHGEKSFLDTRAESPQ